jgi:hypothetical protein
MEITLLLWDGHQGLWKARMHTPDYFTLLFHVAGRTTEACEDLQWLSNENGRP